MVNSVLGPDFEGYFRVSLPCSERPVGPNPITNHQGSEECKAKLRGEIVVPSAIGFSSPLPLCWGYCLLR